MEGAFTEAPAQDHCHQPGQHLVPYHLYALNPLAPGGIGRAVKKVIGPNPFELTQ